MSTIVTRSGKGSALTFNEVDTNFTNLNTDKYQSGNNVAFGTISASGLITANGGVSGALNGSLGATTPSTVVATTIDGTTSIRTTKTFEYPALGSMDGAIKMLSTSGVYGLFGGVSSGGYSWLQTGRNDANATAYTLYLNNQGGDVNLASNKVIASSTGLAVTGLISATTTGQVGTTIGVGAATPSASGAGITFPATQSASTDANTLDDYEEGTWTPNQGGGLTVVGTFSSSGRYTKVGRIVTLYGSMSATTSIVVGTSNTFCESLPFNTANLTYGVIANNSAASQAINQIAWSTSIYCVNAMTATTTLEFSFTYSV